MFKAILRRPLLPLLALPLLLAPVPLPAQAGAGPYVVAESGRSFGRLQDAVDALADLLGGHGLHGDRAYTLPLAT